MVLFRVLAPIAPYSMAYVALLTLRAIIEWSALVAVIPGAGGRSPLRSCHAVEGELKR